jgi:hypothetical protein
MTERQEPSEQPTTSGSEGIDAPEQTRGVGPHEEVTSPGELRTPEVAKKREDIRAHLARIAMYLFVGIVVALLASAIWGGHQWVRVQEFSQIAFGLIGGIVGTVIGFYFGSQR